MTENCFYCAEEKFEICIHNLRRRWMHFGRWKKNPSLSSLSFGVGNCISRFWAKKLPRDFYRIFKTFYGEKVTPRTPKLVQRYLHLLAKSQQSSDCQSFWSNKLAIKLQLTRSKQRNNTNLRQWFSKLHIKIENHCNWGKFCAHLELEVRNF